MNSRVKCCLGLLLIAGLIHYHTNRPHNPCVGAVRSVQVQTEDENLTPPGMPATIYYDKEGKEICRLHGAARQLSTSV